MKNLIVAASLLLATCGLTPAMAQGPQCQTVEALIANVTSRVPGIVIQQLRIFDGAEADTLAMAVDNVVPDDLEYDGVTSIAVYSILINGEKSVGIVFLRDKCVLDTVRVDWPTYQKALTLAFGPRV